MLSPDYYYDCHFATNLDTCWILGDSIKVVVVVVVVVVLLLLVIVVVVVVVVVVRRVALLP